VAQPWSGVVLSSARLEPRNDIDLRLITLNYVPAPVRKIDERTVDFSEEPAIIRVRLAYADDPWLRSVDPGLYQRWTQELGTKPVSFLVCSTKYVSNKTYFPENLLMHLAHEMQVAHKDSRVQAWDFPLNSFVPIEAIEDGIDWQHVVNVVMGREQLYGPDNPKPEPPEGYDDLYPKKKRFWRRGLLTFELIQTQAARRYEWALRWSWPKPYRKSGTQRSCETTVVRLFMKRAYRALRGLDQASWASFHNQGCGTGLVSFRRAADRGGTSQKRRDRTESRS